jgi:hypothetical protein
MMFRFTIGELELVVEALEHRANRHEAMSRYSPRGAGPHDRKADAMRKLRRRLICDGPTWRELSDTA